MRAWVRGCVSACVLACRRGVRARVLVCVRAARVRARACRAWLSRGQARCRSCRSPLGRPTPVVALRAPTLVAVLARCALGSPSGEASAGLLQPPLWRDCVAIGFLGSGAGSDLPWGEEAVPLTTNHLLGPYWGRSVPLPCPILWRRHHPRGVVCAIGAGAAQHLSSPPHDFPPPFLPARCRSCSSARPGSRPSSTRPGSPLGGALPTILSSGCLPPSGPDRSPSAPPGLDLYAARPAALGLLRGLCPRSLAFHFATADTADYPRASLLGCSLGSWVG